MVTFLREMFAANQVIILSVYGQVFFVLAMAIALQSWRHSRLALARSLQWLAAFGGTHALYEWGDVFIPLQSAYMPVPVVELLRSLQSVLLAVSFACLFQFGIELLRPLADHRRFLRYLPTAVLLLWIGWAFGLALAATDDLPHWYALVAIWARYAIGFPGALLAASGLWRQARQLAPEPHLQVIVRALRVAVLALVGYSVMGGLVTPPGAFFPASWLNTARLEQLVVIPVPLLRALLGLVLTVAIIRSLEAFRIELDRRLTSMEEAQVLAAERERIGREIHDGTLQSVYAAGLLLQVTERKLRREYAVALADLAPLQQSAQLLDQAIADMRSYIGTLRTAPDGRSLAASLHELAHDRHLQSLMEVDLTSSIPEGEALTPGQIGHLLAIANEALSNVARHARATRVGLSASVCDGRLRLEIRDNGRGLPVDIVVGYGLRNMRERARMLGGDLALHSQPGHGTLVTIDVPWKESNEQSTPAPGR